MKLAHEVVEVFDKAGSEALVDKSTPEPKPYQHSSPGF